MAAVIIVTTAGGLLYLRLTQGPLHLPVVARLAAERLNAELPETQVSIADAVLTLGKGNVPSGLQFLGVEVRKGSAGVLMKVSRIGARFRTPDLIGGRFHPTEISLIEPRLNLQRQADGVLVLSTDAGGRMVIGEGGGDGATFERLVGGFLGDAQPFPELAELERVNVIDAELTYDDRVSGRYLHAAPAAAEAWRTRSGARATVRVATGQTGNSTIALVLDHRVATGTSDVRVMFNRISGALLAEHIPELALLSAGKMEVSGEVSSRFAGRVWDTADGVLTARGVIGPLGPVQDAYLAFRSDPGSGRLNIEEFRLVTETTRLGASGLFDLSFDADGLPAGMVGQIDLGGLHIENAATFAAPVSLDRGQVLVRWDNSTNTVSFSEGYASRDNAVLRFDARLTLDDDAPLADIRLAASDYPFREFLDHWPIDTAVNARDWIDRNIGTGNLDAFVAQVRLGQGEPQMSIDFAFSGLEARYIPEFPPIRDARGEASLNYHDMTLRMESGTVDVPGAGRIGLGGSEMEISDFWGEVTPADIRLRGRGELAAVLGLLDRKPLRLVSKLGVDTGRIGGKVDARVGMRFPLISDLGLGQIDIDARASLSDLAMPFAIQGKTVRIGARSLALTATNSAMSLRGDVVADSSRLSMAWTENYGARRSRGLEVKGTLDLQLIDRLGLSALGLQSDLPLALSLSQTGNERMRYALSSNLRGMAVELPVLGWRKPVGKTMRLKAEGTFGAEVGVDRFTVEATGLKANGSAVLSDTGALVRADIARLQVERAADVRAGIVRSSQGGLQVNLTGKFLDISGREDGGSEANASPVEVALDLETLRLSSQLALSGARGRFARTNNGEVAARLTGMLGGLAAADILLETGADGRGALRVTSDDAGKVLEAAEIYEGAQGGKLVLDATVGGEGEPELAGRAKITGMRVRSRSTLRNLLDQGGLAEAGKSVSATGVEFRSIRVPFVYDSGVLKLKDAVATSTVLGITAEGTVDETRGTLDIVGVISPAYGLTGALDEVPVLGDILTGGKGEGILAMTFTMDGPLRDPDFSVNPLSLLAPGFLRNIFKGGSAEGAEKFHQRLQRAD